MALYRRDLPDSNPPTELLQLCGFMDWADDLIAAYEAAAPKLDPSIIPLDDLSELSRAEANEVAKLAKAELPDALAREHYLFGTCKMARAKMRPVPNAKPDA